MAGRGRGRPMPTSTAGPSLANQMPVATGMAGSGRGRPILTSTAGPSLANQIPIAVPAGFDLEAFMAGTPDFSTLRPLRSLTGGRGIVNNVVPPPTQGPKETGTEYAKRVRSLAEEEALKSRKEKLAKTNGLTMNVNEPIPEPAPTVTNLEAVSTILQEQPNLINFENFVGPQIGTKTTAKTLPIDEKRTEILKSVRLNQITIIDGPTGCGKTTQVPLFIMEEMIERKEQFHIVVTQPRRIAARSVAKRVADLKGMSLGQDSGSLIGYQIGMDRSTVTPDVHLLFCTTGVLLRRLINSKSLAGYTHIIIDEIHERSVETDFILMIIRRILWKDFPDVKLILMSATFETERLVDYFTLTSDDPSIPSVKPHVVKIDRRPAKIASYYLNQFDTVGIKDLPSKDEFKLENPVLHHALFDVCKHIIQRMDIFEHNEKRDKGGVLIFLPGLNEINDLLYAIKREDAKDALWVLPLHSSINADEQKKVFERPQRGQRKIILATNIAESSITVEDIDYVIDFCLTKNLVVDKETNLPTLKLEWASRTNCKQREGRTGRLRDGRVYRLVPNHFYSFILPEYPEPEIRRTTLESCVLQTKIFDMGHPKDLLALCLDPPNLEDVRAAVLKLKCLGALTILNNDVYDEEDGELTVLGRMMSSLPVDVHLSKLIVMGFIFGLIEESVIIAACLTIGSLFSKPFGEDLESYKARLTWADRSFCDLMASLHAYQLYNDYAKSVGVVVSTYNNLSRRPRDDRRERDLEEWCKRNFIQLKHAREIAGLIEDLKSRLSHMHINVENAPNQKINDVERELLLKIMFAGAFYPNYFFRQQICEEDVRKVFYNHNPTTSVVLSGLPNNQGVLYTNQIQAALKPCSELMDIDYEDTKAVVTFCSDDDPLVETFRKHEFGKVVGQEVLANRLRETAVKNSVYIALMLKKIKPIHITLFPENAAKEKMNYLAKQREGKTEGRWLRTNRFVVPSKHRNAIFPASNLGNKRGSFRVAITHIVNCAHFYAQDKSEEGLMNWRKVLAAIERFEGHPLDKPELGISVLVRTQEDDKTKYLRGLIKTIDEANLKVQVFCVDYGWIVKASLADVVALTAEDAEENPDLFLSPQAIECQLTDIKPSFFRNMHGTWSSGAVKFFENFVERNEGLLDMEIYSIVEGIYRVVLRQHNRNNLADCLIEAGWAETGEESLISIRNHEVRQRTQALENNEGSYEVNSALFAEMETDPRYRPVELRGIDIKRSHKLIGPNSPLEIKFQSCQHRNVGVPINLDRNSVNAIALESEVPCEFQRMIVAAVVAKSSNTPDRRSSIIGRQTSMMPTLRGFPSIMCLLFAPNAELRYQEDTGKLSGALCGLGAFEKDGHWLPYDGDHDIEQSFDVLISKEDLANITDFRVKMSSLLQDAENPQSEGQRTFELSGTALFSRQRQLRREVVSIVTRRRMKLPLDSSNFPAYKWHILKDFNEVKLSDMKSPSFPILQTPRKVKNYLKNIGKEMELLERARQMGVMHKTATCPLDGEKLFTLSAIAEHLDTSKVHAMRKREYEIQISDEKNKHNESFFLVDDVEQELMDQS